MTTGAGSGGHWRWDGIDEGFHPVTGPAEVEIVDSWLVDAGRVRGLGLHARRFAAACAGHHGLPIELTTRFLRASVDRIPVTGRWFPRVEVVLDAGKPRLQLLLRTAPERGDTVRLWYPGVPDRRRSAAVKGADLDDLLALRSAAVAAGGDEAVLLSPGGTVREGSTTSIVWWRGDTLCGPPVDGDVLPSVTRTLLARGVIAAGGSVADEVATPARLADVPMWTVNALHGIRPVTGWLGLDVPAAPQDPVLLALWQAYLDGLAVPVGPELIPDNAEERADVHSG